mgnify:CR=1 FL=1
MTIDEVINGFIEQPCSIDILYITTKIKLNTGLKTLYFPEYVRKYLSYEKDNQNRDYRW